MLGVGSKQQGKAKDLWVHRVARVQLVGEGRKANRGELQRHGEAANEGEHAKHGQGVARAVPNTAKRCKLSRSGSDSGGNHRNRKDTHGGWAHSDSKRTACGRGVGEKISRKSRSRSYANVYSLYKLEPQV